LIVCYLTDKIEAKKGEADLNNSTKSVSEKLNFKKYPNKLILNKPSDCEEFQDIEYDTEVKLKSYDLIFIFVFNLEEMSTAIHHVVEKQILNDNGYLFFAYPKKNNRKYKEYIERDSIIPYVNMDDEGYIPDSTLKFARMVSFNDVFTIVGLKAESKKSKNSTSSKSSQCVDDYIAHVEDIKQYLGHNETLLKVYNNLTVGYQKDWARYVFSAKRKETQEKRLLEMETVIGEGYKSIDLYRRNAK
jgi:hypothetical protein